jgi:hypothetical protein
LSTRKLIIAALVCGLAILVAFAVQLTTAASNQPPDPSTVLPPVTVVTTLPSNSPSGTSAGG